MIMACFPLETLNSVAAFDMRGSAWPSLIVTLRGPSLLGRTIVSYW
jgi:hypothetical protein